MKPFFCPKRATRVAPESLFVGPSWGKTRCNTALRHIQWLTQNPHFNRSGCINSSPAIKQSCATHPLKAPLFLSSNLVLVIQDLGKSVP